MKRRWPLLIASVGGALILWSCISSVVGSAATAAVAGRAAMVLFGGALIVVAALLRRISKLKLGPLTLELEKQRAAKKTSPKRIAPAFDKSGESLGGIETNDLATDDPAEETPLSGSAGQVGPTVIPDAVFSPRKPHGRQLTS